jgi:hypothetical protein
MATRKITKRKAINIEKGLKRTGTYKGKSNRPGGGGRFAQLSDNIQASGKSKKVANAIAATVGRAKYDKKPFQKMAAIGRKRVAKKK